MEHKWIDGNELVKVDAMPTGAELVNRLNYRDNYPNIIVLNRIDR